jgi:phosphoadenosine phosphosulfate reductase
MRARGETNVKTPQQLIADELSTATAPCVTSSFQAEGVVLLHMIRQIEPAIPVVFLDTVHHFRETYAYRDELARRWRLNVVTLRAAQPRPGLWQHDTDTCCARHKVAPLFAALEHYDVWFAALRREQSPTRANLSEVEPFILPTGKVLRKVSPLAAWTKRHIGAYADTHAIPLSPLYELGYTSIGCEPCTSIPLDPTRPRSGRWHGEKLECGIHVRSVRRLT